MKEKAEKFCNINWSETGQESSNVRGALDSDLLCKLLFLVVSGVTLGVLL